MKTFNELDYLKIQVANEAGLDKETYETRLKYFDEVVHMANSPLAVKTKIAIDKVNQGIKHGCPVYFDAIASGIQILSAVTSCKKGCEATGLINTGKRPNPYMLVAELMDMKADYDNIKQATMTAFYGSRKVPREMFGNRLEEFYSVCSEVFPNAYAMINLMINTWDSNKDYHSWVMPDGFQVYIPVLEKQHFTINIDGFEPMGIVSVVQTKKDYGLANAANITHSIDGYIARTLIRHCSYNKTSVEAKLRKVEKELSKRTDAEKVVYGDITRKDYEEMSTGELMGMFIDLSDMLTHKPFDVITVHDNFGCHPKYMNRLRYWYNQIMSRLSTSNLMDNIVSQLLGEEVEIDIVKEDVAAEILDADYAIC